MREDNRTLQFAILVVTALFFCAFQTRKVEPLPTPSSNSNWDVDVNVTGAKLLVHGAPDQQVMVWDCEISSEERVWIRWYSGTPDKIETLLGSIEVNNLKVEAIDARRSSEFSRPWINTLTGQDLFIGVVGGEARVKLRYTRE